MTEAASTAGGERTLQRYRLALAAACALVIGLGVTVWQLTGELIDAESSRRALEQQLAGGRAVRTPSPVPAPATSPAPGSIAEQKRRQRLGVVDLAQRVAALVEGNPENADISETYFATPGGSVHMHILGKGQTTPLHVHEREWEVTAIVSGNPVVRHRHGGPSGITGAERTLQPGDVAVSPPRCAHEWHNPDRDGMQANLVFAAPPFRGNLYVAPDDARLRDAPPPAILHRADAFANAAEPEAPALGASMTRHLVATSAELPARAGASVAYVADGAGTASAAGGTASFARNQLLMVPAGAALTITATRPTLLYHFAPPESAAP